MLHIKTDLRVCAVSNHDGNRQAVAFRCWSLDAGWCDRIFPTILLEYCTTTNLPRVRVDDAVHTISHSTAHRPIFVRSNFDTLVCGQLHIISVMQ